MGLTLEQIQELHELSPEQKYDMNEYFTTKNYLISKKRKLLMRAKQELEQEFEREQECHPQ